MAQLVRLVYRSLSRTLSKKLTYLNMRAVRLYSQTGLCITVSTVYAYIAAYQIGRVCL